MVWICTTKGTPAEGRWKGGRDIERDDLREKVRGPTALNVEYQLKGDIYTQRETAGLLFSSGDTVRAGSSLVLTAVPSL